jgi:adenosylcobinamide kinase/adenosylcobinamide-phosphate guanylyltransferase
MTESKAAAVRPLHHLILGGQRSGKSRHAESMAQRWLADDAGHEVVVIATALAWDDEMRLRIERHRQDRPAGMLTVEEPLHLSRVLRAHAASHRLMLVDCLTLWLTNWLMPADGAVDLAAWRSEREATLSALRDLASPAVMVSNEIGWGVIPMSSQVRAFVDELGLLNQAIASHCGHVTLMVAGQAWTREVVA